MKCLSHLVPDHFMLALDRPPESELRRRYRIRLATTLPWGS